MVGNEFRCKGIANYLNTTRVTYAKSNGAKSIMVTASEGNCRQLLKLGFYTVGEEIVFQDRPKTTFIAMQLDFV